jgi:hypothetical protein
MKWNSVRAIDIGASVVAGASWPGEIGGAGSEGYGSNWAASMRSSEFDSKFSVPWYIPGATTQSQRKCKLNTKEEATCHPSHCFRQRKSLVRAWRKELQLRTQNIPG